MGLWATRLPPASQGGLGFVLCFKGKQSYFTIDKNWPSPVSALSSFSHGPCKASSSGCSGDSKLSRDQNQEWTGRVGSQQEGNVFTH